MKFVAPRIKMQKIFLVLLLGVGMGFAHDSATPKTKTMQSSLASLEFMAVKISEIEVHCEFLEEYKAILKEQSEISVAKEKGVLILYVMNYKDNPCKFSIVESYKNEESYQAHIASKHFQKYKQSTLHMIKSLKFIPMEALNPQMALQK